MYKDLTDAVKAEIANGATYNCFIFVGNNFPINYTHCLTQANIVKDSFKLERGFSASTSITYGDVVAGVLDFSISKDSLPSDSPLRTIQWSGECLYTFIYPRFVNGTEINFTPELVDTDSDIVDNAPHIWGGKSTAYRKYGYIYHRVNGEIVEHPYNKYLIPFQPFYVENPKNNKYIIDITAYDVVGSLDLPFVDNYPDEDHIFYFIGTDNTPDISSVDGQKTLYAEIVTQGGIDVSGVDLGYRQYKREGNVVFPKFQKSKMKYPITSYSLRDLLSAMAMTNGVNLVSDREPFKLKAVGLNNNNDSFEVNYLNRYSFDASNVEYQTKKIIFNLYKTTYDYYIRNLSENTIKYNLLFDSNVLLNAMSYISNSAGEAGARDCMYRLQDVLSNGTATKHCPFQAEILSNPCIDPGDRALIDNFGGENYSVNTPITSVTFKLNGVTEINTTNMQKPITAEQKHKQTVQTQQTVQRAAEQVEDNIRNPNILATSLTWSSGNNIINDYNKYSIYLVSVTVLLNGEPTTLKSKILCYKETFSGLVTIHGFDSRQQSGNTCTFELTLEQVSSNSSRFKIIQARRTYGESTTIYNLQINEIIGVI